MTQFFAQAIFGDITIPPSQALPPAGFDTVAFRPNCSQVVPVGQANGVTAWTLPMPDGQNLTLLELEPMDTNRAWMELDSYGLCKIGGDIVPILYARQLPQRSFAAPMVEATSQTQGSTQPAADLAPTSEPQGGGMVGMVAGSVVLVAIAAGVVAYSRRKPKPLGAGPAGPLPEGKGKAAPKAKTPKAKDPDRADTRRSQLDDLLGGGK